MTKLIVAFHNFVNRPKNASFLILHKLHIFHEKIKLYKRYLPKHPLNVHVESISVYEIYVTYSIMRLHVPLGSQFITTTLNY
jgi:hypothetical protein